MKNQYQKPQRDRELKQLDKDLTWDQGRQQSLQRKIVKSMSDTDVKLKRKGTAGFLYAASIAAFMLFIVVGYSILSNDNSRNSQDSEQPPVGVEQETKDENDPELQYNDTDDAPAPYYSLAMTDENYMYFIEVNVPNMPLEKIAEINFSASEAVNNQLSTKYGLRMARNDIPLEKYETANDQLSLFFKKEDLMNIHGSTGIGMGIHSINTFAANFKDEVYSYTAYGDGEPFNHPGEEFSLENQDVRFNRFYFPVNTEKDIYLAYNYRSYENEEDLLSVYFSKHTRPDIKTTVDFSMFSYESLSENQDGQLEIFIEGNTTEAVEVNQMNEDNLMKLLTQGLGLNINHQLDVFEDKYKEVIIQLNGKQIEQMSLSNIRPNIIEEFWELEDEKGDSDITDLTLEVGSRRNINDLLEKSSDVAAVAWSPDRERVIFAYSEDNSDNSKTYLWKVGDKKPTAIDEIEGYITDFFWSPNSEYVVTDTGTSLHRSGIIYSVEEARIVSSTFAYSFGFEWSPDSDNIVYGKVNNDIAPIIETELSGTIDLAIYNVETTEVTVIDEANEAYYYVPTDWKPDGFIYYEKHFFDVEKNSQSLSIKP